MESRSAPGDSLELVPSNGTSDLIGYNLCPATLSIEVRGDWTPVPSDRICTMELRTLDPGREGRYDLQLPADLEPGRYRYQTDVVNLSTDAIEQISSEAFDVE